MRQNALFRTRICHLHALTCRSNVPNSLFRRAVRSLRSSLALHSLQISSSRTAYAVSFALSAGRFCVVATRFCPSRKSKILARGPRSHFCNAVRSLRSSLSLHPLQISSSGTAAPLICLVAGLYHILCQPGIIRTSLRAILFGAFAQPKLANMYTIACVLKIYDFQLG